MSMAQTVRRDGKRRRTPRLGLQPRKLTPPSKLREGERQPVWEELVLPPSGAARVDVEKKTKRAERKAASRTRKTVLVHEGVMPRAYRRATKGRGYVPGRLVLHATRLTSRSGGGIDRSAVTPAAAANRIATKTRTEQRRAARLEDVPKSVTKANGSGRHASIRSRSRSTQLGGRQQ